MEIKIIQKIYTEWEGGVRIVSLNHLTVTR